MLTHFIVVMLYYYYCHCGLGELISNFEFSSRDGSVVTALSLSISNFSSTPDWMSTDLLSFSSSQSPFLNSRSMVSESDCEATRRMLSRDDSDLTLSYSKSTSTHNKSSPLVQHRGITASDCKATRRVLSRDDSDLTLSYSKSTSTHNKSSPLVQHRGITAVTAGENGSISHHGSAPLITLDNVAKAMGALSAESHPDLRAGRSHLMNFKKHSAVLLKSAQNSNLESFSSFDSFSKSFEFGSQSFGPSSSGVLDASSKIEMDSMEVDCNSNVISSTSSDFAYRALVNLLSTSSSILHSLKKCVPSCARAAIESNTLEYLGELRKVVTLFIEIINFDEDLENGSLDTLQKVFQHVMRPLFRYGGMLRQFVVDDKGCVIIAGFGVPGYNYEDNETRAVETAVLVRQSLINFGFSCRIGIAEGDVYCGLVGTQDRCEYVMMGSSVNLAARLMGKAGPEEIYVSDEVYKSSAKEFTYEELPVVQVCVDIVFFRFRICF